MIQTMPLGAYQTNCYLCWGDDSDTCFVIDPGYQSQTVLDWIRSTGKTLQAILLTHGHFDHVGAVRELAAKTGCDVYLCADDLSMPEQLTAGPLYYTRLYGEGDVLHLAGLSVRVLHTPGHTPGSVCLITGNALFSGDTLFQGSCGRTDLPGGSWATILQSLKRLRQLDTNYTVYPGHGAATTLDDEKHFNPYLKG